MKKSQTCTRFAPNLGGGWGGGPSAAIVPYPKNLGRNAPIPEDSF